MDNRLRGGLNKLASALDVARDDNNEHQAGSDSKLTARCLFAIMQEFGQDTHLEQFINEVFNISYQSHVALCPQHFEIEQMDEEPDGHFEN